MHRQSSPRKFHDGHIGKLPRQTHENIQVNRQAAEAPRLINAEQKRLKISSKPDLDLGSIESMKEKMILDKNDSV